MPVAALMAWQAASIMPSPSVVASVFSLSRTNTTVELAGPTLLPRNSIELSSKARPTWPPSSSATIASSNT